jgi:putative membrane protein
LLYALGVSRLWRRAGRGRGISRNEVLLFVAGWVVLALALVSPIDPLGGELFSVHMVQHELLMVAAAPLLVLARPLEAWAWSLPRAWIAGFGRVSRYNLLARLWRAITEPVGAWLLHAGALWLWHVPAFFEAALRNEALHALQHSTFLGTALLLWWSVLQPRGQPDGLGLASLFTTMLHTGALGALLTFAPRAWYSIYEGTSPYGLTVLEDQQLGGLVMWVPGGLAYLLAGLALVYSMQPDERPAA